MKGDFSMDRFDPSKNYNRVLKQQGRVELDSDWNEGAAISQHLLRSFVADIVGRHAGPMENCGFALADAEAEGMKPVVGDLLLGRGRYYVDGLMIENPEPCFYTKQPWRSPVEKLEAGHAYVAYLDVWERHVTYIEDDSICEIALGGPDTCTRAQTVWQVRVWDPNARPRPRGGEPTGREAIEKQIEELRVKIEAARMDIEGSDTAAAAKLKRSITKMEKDLAQLKSKLEESLSETEGEPPETPECNEVISKLRAWKSGTIAARLEKAAVDENPCVLPPESRYRGLENHLYRIEIHTSGDTRDINRVPTFKWSRENGSVAARWLGTTGNEVRVANSRGFAAGQYVELTSETDDLNTVPGPISRIVKIDGDIITLESAPAWKASFPNLKIRRWDQKPNDEQTLTDGAIAIQPGTGEKGWIKIEDGIEIQFSEGEYRTGDYWLIPARVVSGDIVWPTDGAGDAMHRLPAGIVHHYAPLFIVEATGTAPFVKLVHDCRCRFAPLPCIEDR
jgi:hypothetical protein